ncbi:hypothetical protein HYG87_10670 [Methanobacterium alkalithermotolerans]|uniref:Uncharacterized protein n=1 Tax=Methanobacterium alkalithermotolerans TaxID=2731220 RepID=A0A8T8K826_9EURY|nr:hypothetical protein [Methanobacterium alkalithermotolerans]QUH24187.1 hypothetical protein HYG87_10670 [Methanobacterium alkalithermotolerans]
MKLWLKKEDDNIKSIADMDDKELMEYFRQLEKQGEGKSVSIEELKENYYKCQRLAVQAGRIAEQAVRQRDLLFELLQLAREEIIELKKK